MQRTNIEYTEGKKHISSHGYVKVYIGRKNPLADSKGFAYEHRLVAMKKLGRPLVDKERAHHKDENKTNNSDDNIKVVNGNFEHYVFHRKSGKPRRMPNEKNHLVSCECGCGNQFFKYDMGGRPRRFVSGHRSKKLRSLCKCGCGEIVKTIGKHYKPGHSSQRQFKLKNNREILCGCGCGEKLMKYDSLGRERKYINGHYVRIQWEIQKLNGLNQFGIR